MRVRGLMLFVLFYHVLAFPKLVCSSRVKYEGELRRLLMFTFQSHRCIQVTSDESDLALEIIRQMYQSSGNTSFINGINMDLKSCHGFVLISKHIKDAMGLLDKVSLFYENRILILIISEGTHRHLEMFIQNASKWIGDSEVLLSVLGQPSRHFIRQQPSERLDELPHIRGIWVQEQAGVQDFKGRSVKVGTFNCSVFSSFVVDEKGQPFWFGGMELILVKESFDRLNLKLNIVTPTTSDLWGHYDGVNWSDGIMGLLSAGEVDIAFCGLWIVSSMVRCELETTFPVAEGCLKLIVPKPHYLNSGWFTLFNPFSQGVWAFIGISVLVASVLLFCASSFVRAVGMAEPPSGMTHECFNGKMSLERALRDILAGKAGKVLAVGLSGKPAPRGLAFSFLAAIARKTSEAGLSLVASVFWAVSLLLASGHGESSINPIRQIVIWWINLGFVLTVCYSSGLITQLTSPTLSQKMESIQQLVENDFVWTSPFALDVNLMLDFNNTWESTWAKRMRVIPDQQREWEAVATSKVALFGQQYGKEAFTLDSEYPAELLKKFEITSDCINTYRIGLVLRPGSPYFKPLENHILRYHSGGLVDKILNDQFEKVAMVQPYVREVFDTMKKTVKAGEKLNVDNLKGAFLLLIIGSVGSSIVFLFEIPMKLLTQTM